MIDASYFKTLADKFYENQANPNIPVQMLTILKYHLDLNFITADQYDKLCRFWTSTVR